MFGLGMGELLVILVLALLFLGPKRLPEVATNLGKAIRSFRKATGELTGQLEADEALKQPMRELKAALRDEPALASVAHTSAQANVAAHANVAARRPAAAPAPPAPPAPPAEAAAVSGEPPKRA